MSKKNNDLQNAMIQAQKAPVEYIAFSGGGAKGAAYSGVYSALSDAGIIKNIKADTWENSVSKLNPFQHLSLVYLLTLHSVKNKCWI